jgi:hypothetical protein
MNSAEPSPHQHRREMTECSAKLVPISQQIPPAEKRKNEISYRD